MAPWQGFLVQRNDMDAGAANSLTFDASGKTTGANFIGSKSGASDYRKIDLDLVAYDGSGQVQDRDRQAAAFFFNDISERDWDAYDATKLQPLSWSYVALGSVGEKRGEEVLQSQTSLPYHLERPLEIPVELQTENVDPSELEIVTSTWKNVPEEWTVTLVDTKGSVDTSDHEEVVLGNSTRYSFTLSSSKQATSKEASSSAAGKAERRTGPPRVQALTRETGAVRSKETSKAANGSDTTRFVVRIEPGGALPVEMAGVEAQVQKESVLLQWQTTSETNNAGFYVEHRRLPTDTTKTATASSEWQRRGFVEGAGTTNDPQQYQHKIADLGYGRHAFRLHQVDTDGDVAYSQTVKTQLRLESSHAVGAPYPNPVHQRATLDVTVRKAQPVTIEMYDVLGRRVQTVYKDDLAGQKTQRVRIRTSGLSSGHYFLRVTGDDFSEVRRMTVVK